jgi:hypothetical protein
MTFNISQIGEGIYNPLSNLWNSAIMALPGIIAAIVILIAGYIIAMLLGLSARHLVRLTQIDGWMAKHEKEKAIGGLKLSSISGQLIKWWIFIIFLIPAANVIQFNNLSLLLTTFAIWFTNLILAVIITLLGLIVAHTFSEVVGKAKKLNGIKGVKKLVYIATLVIFMDIALRQIGVNIIFIEAIILIILLGFMIALAIGFGLGLKPHAEKIIKNLMKKLI